MDKEVAEPEEVEEAIGMVPALWAPVQPVAEMGLKATPESPVEKPTRAAVVVVVVVQAAPASSLFAIDPTAPMVFLLHRPVERSLPGAFTRSIRSTRVVRSCV